MANGDSYKNNYARAAAYFLSTMAPAPVDPAALAGYRLITGIYRAVSDDAAALGYVPVPDAPFEPWEQQKGREKDIKNIRAPIDKIESLAAELFAAVEAGTVSDDGSSVSLCAPLGRTLKKALAAAGASFSDGLLSAEKGCFSALRELAAISRAHTVHITDGPKEDKPYLLFSRCVFDPSDEWTAKAFDAILGADGALLRLCGELRTRGYERVDCFDGKKITLDYVKQHGKKTEPLKWAWAERTHSGVAVTYEELRAQPAFLWVRLPEFTTILQSGDNLPPRVVEFIKNNTKTCDGCRYCVQTDKTGARPLACVSFAGKKKCPRFPGFTFNWRRLDDALAADILALLDAVQPLV